MEERGGIPDQRRPEHLLKVMELVRRFTVARGTSFQESESELKRFSANKLLRVEETERLPSSQRSRRCLFEITDVSRSIIKYDTARSLTVCKNRR